MPGKTICAAMMITLALCSFSCKEIQGPAGPPGEGIESLTDPSVQPKIIYTYPPSNSRGPYDDLYLVQCGFENCYYYSRFQVRFNKIMEFTSVRHAISLSSPFGNHRADTNYFFSAGGDIYFVLPTDSTGYPYNLRWKVGEVDTFRVSSTAKDINGNFLQPSFAMTFEPEPYFRVRRVYPTAGATDVYDNASISLYFNSPVDTSIFSKVQISPSIGGQWGLGVYDDSTYIYYGYSGSLKSNTTYTITINAAAQDKYGNQIPQQFVSRFTTASFRVSRTYPSNGATNVNAFNSIEIDFTEILDTGTVRSSFKIIPPTPGSLYLYEGNAFFTFSPFDGLLLDTPYTITVDTSLRSKSGDRLSAPYTFSFRTVPFRVNLTTPPDGQTYVLRNSNIFVQFNAPIDTASARAAFSLRDSAGVEVSGIFNFSFYEAPFFNFAPSAPLAANARYRATISTAMRSKNGAQLKTPYTFSFTTEN